MKAKELRIGNLYDENGTISEVTPSVIQDVFDADRIWCKPIPLTEEWLLRFGFEKKQNDWFRLNDFEISPSFECFSFRSCVWVSKYTNPKVHQLQNLYFALTVEELTTKN